MYTGKQWAENEKNDKLFVLWAQITCIQYYRLCILEGTKNGIYDRRYDDPYG